MTKAIDYTPELKVALTSTDDSVHTVILSGDIGCTVEADLRRESHIE